MKILDELTRLLDGNTSRKRLQGTGRDISMWVVRSTTTEELTLTVNSSTVISTTTNGTQRTARLCRHNSPWTPEQLAIVNDILGIVELKIVLLPAPDRVSVRPEPRLYKGDTWVFLHVAANSMPRHANSRVIETETI